MAMTITTAATMILVNSSLNATKMEVGASAIQVAESGVDNALIRLLRDPTYTGEVMTVGTGTATVVVSTVGSVVTITSTGRVGSSTRKISVNAGYSNGYLQSSDSTRLFTGHNSAAPSRRLLLIATYVLRGL